MVRSMTRRGSVSLDGATAAACGLGIRYAELMAPAVLGAVLLLAGFPLFQRQFVQRVASTGIS